MESWSTAHTQTHTPSPTIKFENSPNDSLLSTPGEMYPSLFGAESSPAPSVMADPTSDVAMLASLAALTQANTQSPTPVTPSSTAGTPEPEKKPVKKRKSWGQVLPEPKTNLPPRKRAKTEDEKEQRRVERVLRNRRAAQSSRERKRLEVEGLEKRNQELEAALAKATQTNEFLLEQLRNAARLGAGAGSPETFDALRLSSQLSFSQPLFGSQDGHSTLAKPDSLSTLHNTQNNTTVDPAALTPISEVDEEHELPATVSTPVADSAPVANASPDATQHPAEMLCQDLQCRSAEAPPSAWLENSQQQLRPALALYLQLQFLLTSTSALISLCQRPLMQIAMSLKAGFSLPPVPALLTTIIWLVTTPKPSRSRSTTSTLTSMTSSPTTPTSPPATSSSRSNLPPARSQTRPSSLRLRLLRKILTCSPSLARPLMDATMAALRLVSSDGFTVDRVKAGDASAAAAADGKEQQQQQSGRPATWPTGVPLPSKEVLLTLLWVLKVEERRLEIRQQVSPKLGSNSCVPKTVTPTINNQARHYVLTVVSKRKPDSLEGDRKRHRSE
ncbi:transcription factor that binds to CRE motif [Podospora pseudopauciseta]|uniref:Transcription factor that binds to CRE motif n=1 Tax=Podospora pseudopauciseta TaxID=2093780 RepID=A0ABR0I3A6_9PEZI|nr:transcription factor that binds to CRE motif [Podospora pseudopauciseta]